MNIGFDAKRAFHNNTGLGNYSRTLIHSLHDLFPENNYYLFNPKKSNRYQFIEKNIHEILPTSFFDTSFPSLWRSHRVISNLRKLNIQIYHGLSHEIPLGIEKTNIKSVVTIHDLIIFRHPEHYKKIDVIIHEKKIKYACQKADHIIAISEQTKKDIIQFFNIDEKKISICYQSCDKKFEQKISEQEINLVKQKLGLPENYFLYVGSITERKNLLTICKAMLLNKDELNIPLVVIGNGKKYKVEVENFLQQNNLTNAVIFLSDDKLANTLPEYISGDCFPAIYQAATALVYPSLFEGFGIPILEALWSETPVITSNTSCLPEAGGEGSYYVDALNPEQIATGMKEIFNNKSLADEIRKKGKIHAMKFSPEKCAASVMKIYKTL
jgi:glycosyltransferase involved in cell wall biosynthesis